MLMVITSYYNDRLKLWKMIHIIHHLSVKYDVHAIIFVMSVTGCRVSSSSWYVDICGTSQVVPREPPHHFKLMHYSHSLEWVTLASADCRPLNITNFINKKNVEYVINNTDCSASFSELVLYIQCIILWHQKMVLLSQQLQEIAHTIPLNTSDHLILFCFYYYWLLQAAADSTQSQAFVHENLDINLGTITLLASSVVKQAVNWY